jgi:hypothetical protein
LEKKKIDQGDYILTPLQIKDGSLKIRKVDKTKRKMRLFPFPLADFSCELFQTHKNQNKSVVILN